MTKKLMPAVALASLVCAQPAGVMGAPLNDGGDVGKMLAEIKLELANGLQRVESDVKKVAEQAMKETKDQGDLTAKVKAQADELIVAQGKLSTALEKVENQLEGVTSKQLEIAQQIAAGLSQPKGKPQSLGQRVAESDRIKAFIESGHQTPARITVENAITTAAGSGGGLIATPEEMEPVRIARRQLRIVDLLQRGTVTTDTVRYRKQTLRTNAAAMIAEQGTIPKSSYGYSKATAPVRKIGHAVDISEETVADAPQLQAEVDGELVYGLELEREAQVLAGDGTGENLSGLITEATSFVAAAGLDDLTRIDRLRLAILQLSLADYICDGFVMNPTDWTAIDLLKDTQGRFIFGNPGMQSQPMLWGKPVVESNTMAVGSWLAGDMDRAATFYERDGIEVLISNEHGTNFLEDMLTMKATQRVALAVKNQPALVTGDFTF